MDIFDRVWRGYGAVLYALGLIAGLMCFLMMAIVSINVIGRYLFNVPLSGAFEATQSMLTVMVFFSMALTQYHGGHIRVVVLTRRMPEKVRRALNVAMLGAGAILFGLASFATFHFAMESYSVNEQEWGSIRYPIYPIKFVVFAGLVLLTIQFALDMIKEMLGVDGSS